MESKWLVIGGSVKKAQRILCLETDKSIFVIQVASFVFLLQQNTVGSTTEIAKIAGWGPSGEELLGKGQGPWQQLSLLAVLFNIFSLHGSQTAEPCLLRMLEWQASASAASLRWRNDAPRGQTGT